MIGCVSEMLDEIEMKEEGEREALAEEDEKLSDVR